ncbi:hypothetical protein BCR36DRAFT_326017 [Piromyces finnis]|uniref:Coth-domain-containing protein n=1 Tax=Piromyces finnis TaxID=1754191 RepID=A0A1Y1VA32_9FUNG|nr:hypothetical protein BCR36DRAFT_326017 [Piromyces finnis]|eukprot:ORX51035.1 hypothetical protein BCR36DRAFT_326017 [Piromyces finnis]
MKGLFKISTLLLALGSRAFGNFIENLGRDFEIFDNTVINIDVKFPEDKYEELMKAVQINADSTEVENVQSLTDYEIKNATITFTYGDKTEVFENSIFKTGGMFSRSNQKVGYNLKLSRDFLGRKSYKVRAEFNDYTRMRQKLSYDILNRSGEPSVQAAFSKLTINDKFFGFYTFTDVFKPHMLKTLFNLESTKNMILYQNKVEGFFFNEPAAPFFVDSTANDEEEGDFEELEKINKIISESKSIEDLEPYIDVDNFLRHLAFDWLFGSFDSLIITGHNFYLYKRPSDNKWQIFYYDFDFTFGHGVEESFGVTSIDFSYFPFEFYNANSNVLVNSLVMNDNTRFKKILKEILINCFNPTILNKRIDEIKAFIDPYIKEDYTPIDGALPGRVNLVGKKETATYELFQASTERHIDDYHAGLKPFIESIFNVACEEFGLDPKEIQEASATAKPISFFQKMKGLPSEDLTDNEEEEECDSEEEIVDVNEPSNVDDEEECDSEEEIVDVNEPISTDNDDESDFEEEEEVNYKNYHKNHY